MTSATYQYHLSIGIMAIISAMQLTSSPVASIEAIDPGLGRGGLLAAVGAENAASGGITHLDDDFGGCRFVHSFAS